MSSNASANEKPWKLSTVGAQKGDKEERNRIVKENMGLVYMVAKRFGNRGVEQEELVQIGSIGLIKAADKFDPELGFSFSTYAVPLIMGEIRRFLRDDSMIHVSRQLKEHARKIAIVRENIMKTENREPTMDELQIETGLSREDLVVAMESVYEVESISRPMRGEEGDVTARTLEDQLMDQTQFETPVLNRLALQQLLEELQEQEAMLIRLRFLEEQTQTQVARVLGMNQVAVSRMEKKILGKLRRRLV